jgi:hypothetical protein
MLPNFFPIMSFVLVSYKGIKFYQIIGGGGLWYGMAPPIHVGNPYFQGRGGGAFRQLLCDFLAFFVAIAPPPPPPPPQTL